MSFKSISLLLVMACLFASLTGCGNDVTDHAMHHSTTGEPVNFLRYNESFASAGMPDAAYIKKLAAEGVDAVINIAPPDAHGSLENEAALVEAASMTYLNIAVDWTEPTQADVDEFLTFMQSRQNDSVFLHCQMNMRATAFAMLHRIINQRIDPAQAESDMHEVWKPNRTWSQLINTALARYDVDYQVAVPDE